MSSSATARQAGATAGGVLLTLASGQFLMTLDSSVMNVAIATVAEDVGTTVTGIQAAITLYTLVMAMFMVAGGKIGSMIGRRRAFAIGCVIYGLGSLTTSSWLSPAESRRPHPRRHPGSTSQAPCSRPSASARPCWESGLRILPLSVTLLAAAVGIPRFFPDASPRRVVRLGLLAMFAGIVVLLAAVDPAADARIVTLPLLLAGLGIGALASQLGAVTVSAVPDELSPEVGGLQDTATNLGAAIGTALAGSLLITALTTSFLQGVQQNPAVPDQVKSQANVQLAGGVPFLSDTGLREALAWAGTDPAVTQAALEVNRQARVDGLRSALTVLALIALVGLFVARRVPDRPPGAVLGAAPGAAEAQ
jgi:MFS family permease